MITNIETIFKFVLFYILMILVFDIGGSIYTKINYKAGLDFACKAASMEIQRDDDYAKGIIRIHTERSKEEFKRLMKKNFGLRDDDVEHGILYAGPVNTVPANFIHPANGKVYVINETTFIAVFQVKRKGIFLNNTITVDNLSGSQVTLRKKDI